MSSYPKWLYHPTKDAVVVVGEAAHKALGSGWFESPAEAKSEPKKEAETIAELADELSAKAGLPTKPKKVK